MKYIYSIISIITVFLFISSCGSEKNEVEETILQESSSTISITKEQFEQSEFQLGTAKTQTMAQLIEATGKLEVATKNKANISTLLPGTVGHLSVMEGQYVRKGQRLFTITNPSLINDQEKYLTLQSEWNYLKSEFARQSQLAEENLTTQKSLNFLQSNLNSTEAQFKALRKKLTLYGISPDQISASNLVSSLAIVAPISGIVSHINVLNGSYLEPSNIAVSLTKADNLLLTISVLENHINAISIDQSISFSMQSDPSKTYIAAVQQINPIPDDDGLIKVLATIQNQSPKLKPGMFANVIINIQNSTQTVLPKSAVVHSGQKAFLLRLDDQNQEAYQFTQVPVEIIMEDNDYFAISGLQDTSVQYLTKGAYYLIH